MTRAPEAFTTTRLVATRPTVADEEFLVSAWADPRVNTWLGGARDRAGVRALQAHFDELWDTHGLGCWITRDRFDGTPVGWVLLHPMDFGGHIGTEVGWTVVADRQGQGFATEAAERVVEIAFTECGFDEIIAGTMTENVASRVVMEKLGFTYDCETEHAGLPHVLYRLTKKDWEADHG